MSTTEPDLPEGWAAPPLLEAIDYEGGGQPPKKEFVYDRRNGYVRLLQIRDFGEKPFPTYVPDSTRLKKANADDLLLARYGGDSADDSLGRICTGLAGAYNVALVKLVFAKELITPGYVRAFFLGPWFKSAISVNSRSCQQGFNRGDLAPVTFPITPLAEQRRIVTKVEELLARVNTARERLAKAPAILKRFRQSVLAAACSGQLTADWRDTADDNGIPCGWKQTTLGKEYRLERGRFLARPRNDPRFYGGKHPFIQIGNLPPDGGSIASYTQTLNAEGLKVSRMFPKGTPLIAIVGATIGNTGVLAFDSCAPDSLVAIIGATEIENRFAELYLRSRKLDVRNSSYASGGQPNINLQTLAPYPINLPPEPEQEEIVQRVDSLFALADKIEARVQAATARVEKITQAILFKAFRGELVPTEAELARQEGRDYEPASALLARIRAHRVASETAPKRPPRRRSSRAK